MVPALYLGRLVTLSRKIVPVRIHKKIVRIYYAVGEKCISCLDRGSVTKHRV